MLQSTESINLAQRIALWFGSVLVSVVTFTLLFCVIFNARVAVLLVFRLTMLLALPVACLYLPFVVMFRNAEERRGRIILLTATLIGPVSVTLWCLFVQLRGANPETVWRGDPLIGIGGIAGVIFACLVGCLTACCYIAALKLLHPRTAKTNVHT